MATTLENLERYTQRTAAAAWRAWRLLVERTADGQETATAEANAMLQAVNKSIAELKEAVAREQRKRVLQVNIDSEPELQRQLADLSAYRNAEQPGRYAAPEMIGSQPPASRTKCTTLSKLVAQQPPAPPPSTFGMSLSQ